MNYKRLEELLFAYEIATQCPDVSGAEHLDMLLTRSTIEQHKSQMTLAQNQRLFRADHRLTQEAQTFYTAIVRITNLAQWRLDENAFLTLVVVFGCVSPCSTKLYGLGGRKQFPTFIN